MNWKQLGDSVSNSQRVFVNSQYIFLTGLTELWRAPKSILPALNKVSNTKSISSVSIIDCFPNPATSFTRIQYSIPQHSEISLEAFDITGRRVARIASGALDAGEHEALWDTKALPSGTYVIRLSAGGKSAAKGVVKLSE